MPFRSLLQTWLQNTAKAKLRATVVQAARHQLAAQSPAPPAAEGPKTCHLGVVFALGIESGCFEDVLQGIVTIRANRFVAREGGLNGRRVVVILSGPGPENAAHATEILIDGHRPRRVVSAGFAGGLCPDIRRNDILVADRLLSTEGGDMAVELPAGLSAVLVPRPGSVDTLGATAGLSSSAGNTVGQANRGTRHFRSVGALGRQGVHRGPLLTAGRVVRLPSERQSLFRRYGAMAVDMETFAVAEVCRVRNVGFSSIRVVNDASGETLPRDVEHLLAQSSRLAQWGAALGAIWRRPASVKDMYQLHENALVASLRLARFLAETEFD